MRLDGAEAGRRLAEHTHGVLCTLHPDRGPDPVPVVYCTDDAGHLAIPVDSVKPKTSTHLRREDNLVADPRAALLIERWDADDWSRLWWVRATLRHLPDPATPLSDDLAERLAAAVPQYRDRPFHRVLVFDVAAVTGWSAAD